MYTKAEHKELALISAYIVSYDLLELGSFFNTFDAAYECAKAFLVEYPEGTEWGVDTNKKEWDETLEEFVINYKNS